LSRTASKKTITVLAQGLQPLALAAGAENRYPALEMLLSRGHRFLTDSKSPDHFRFRLFGIEPEGVLPVAALTQAGDRYVNPGQNQYWLRLDPVTVWADMARVVMTSFGFADLDEFERNEIENVVRAVLDEEGIVLHADHPERWCIALGEPLTFGFTPLEDALGVDMAEVLPEQPESLHWRRIMNEIQIALHASPVNVRRRQIGRQEINSIWFWGGGFIPDASQHGVFETVYSDNPVTRGLAIINDSQLRKQRDIGAANFSKDGQSILIDWLVKSRYALEELESLERLVDRLLRHVRGGSMELVLYCGKNEGWRFRRASSKKFWRRCRPLGKVCSASSPA
jgi:hypothetical protein